MSQRNDSDRASRREQHLRTLVARYNRRTKTSKALATRYRRTLANNAFLFGFRPATKEMIYPIVAARSLGPRLWDVDGNEYLDLLMGFGVNFLGHNPPAVVEAVRAQLERGMGIGPQWELAFEAATLLCELTGMDRVFFTNSGTEAVMGALRIARASRGRERIALFADSFHGHADGTNVLPGLGSDYGMPSVAGVPAGVAKDVIVLEYGSDRALETIARHQNDLAAVLVEPVQTRRPGLQPREFLVALRELTTRAGIVLIFDEMVTGFRIHQRGAQGWFGVEADIATYGKAITGGLPMGAIAGKETYMNAVDGGVWTYGDDSCPHALPTLLAGTFCKNPVTMAASGAVLRTMRDAGPNLQGDLNALTARFIERLTATFGADGPIRVQHCGPIVNMSLDAEEDADLLGYHLIDRGVYIRNIHGHVAYFSTTHAQQDFDRAFLAIQDAVAEMRNDGVIS